MAVLLEADKQSLEQVSKTSYPMYCRFGSKDKRTYPENIECFCYKREGPYVISEAYCSGYFIISKLD